MHDTAAHLVNRLIPQVPVRQEVLSLPRWTRFLLARDPMLITRSLDIALRTTFAHQRRRARRPGALRGCVALDDKGFVKTGNDLTSEDLAKARWPLGRGPYPLETMLPGLFAAGNVRAGSVKRIASAVGEAAACIQLVQKALAE